MASDNKIVTAAMLQAHSPRRLANHGHCDQDASGRGIRFPRSKRGHWTLRVSWVPLYKPDDIEPFTDDGM